MSFVLRYSQQLQQVGLPALSGNIYCIGRNYREHAAELNNPVPKAPIVFLKAPSALRGLDPVPMAFGDETFHYEAEIVLLIGKPVALKEKADFSAVAGITLGLDLTRRAVQDELKKSGHPWTMAKSFQGAAVLAPMLPRSMFSAPEEISFQFILNGELRQQGNSHDMIFPIPALLSHLAQMATLAPGDLVFSGTPAGVGPIKVGDRFEVGFPSLG